MTQIELAKKVLSEMNGESFPCDVNASEGGACGDDWCEESELSFSASELRGLIHERFGHDELFEGLKMVKVDVDAKLWELAEEDAWPDGGAVASVNEVIPDELAELSEKLSELDVDDAEAVAALREELGEVEGGKYTFYFDIVNGDGDYYFAEDEVEEIELTVEEVLGLLRGAYDIPEVFDGICDKTFDEDLINGKAAKMGFAEDSDCHSYGGSCEALDVYLDAWNSIIDGILSGNITEDNVEDWLGYFEDREDWDISIEDWMEDFEAFEDEED